MSTSTWGCGRSPKGYVCEGLCKQTQRRTNKISMVNQECSKDKSASKVCMMDVLREVGNRVTVANIMSWRGMKITEKLEVEENIVVARMGL